MATAATFSYVNDNNLNYINNVNSVTATYSVSLSDSIIYTNFSGGASHSVTLPFSAQSGVGKAISIYTAGTTASVLSQSGDTVNGITSNTIGNGVGKTFVSDGLTHWFSV